MATQRSKANSSWVSSGREVGELAFDRILPQQRALMRRPARKLDSPRKPSISPPRFYTSSGHITRKEEKSVTATRRYL